MVFGVAAAAAVQRSRAECACVPQCQDGTTLVEAVSAPKLELHCHGVEGELPRDWSAQSALRVLEIADSPELRGTFPLGLGDLGALQTISITDAPQLVGSVPASFASLQRLHLVRTGLDDSAVVSRKLYSNDYEHEYNDHHHNNKTSDVDDFYSSHHDYYSINNDYDSIRNDYSSHHDYGTDDDEYISTEVENGRNATQGFENATEADEDEYYFDENATRIDLGGGGGGGGDDLETAEAGGPGAEPRLAADPALIPAFAIVGAVAVSLVAMIVMRAKSEQQQRRHLRLPS